MKDRILLYVLFGSIVFVTSSTCLFGQAQKGAKELLLSGNVTTFFQGSTNIIVGTQTITIPSDSFTNGTLILGLGYYITQQVEVFAGGIITITGGPTGTNVAGGMNSAFRYNFSAPGRKAVPYVSLEYFLSDASSPKETSFLRPNGGLKYYFKPNIAIDFNAGWGRNAFADGPKLNIINEQIGLVFAY